jgi:hypothetical protein
MESAESTIQRKTATKRTRRRTTTVDAYVSFLVGQVTFFSSLLTLARNSVTLLITLDNPDSSGKIWQARRDSNPQHPVLETGALAVRATGLHERSCHESLLGLAMPGMLPAETAVFAELQLVRSSLLVLGGGVIALLALGASQSNDVPHGANPSTPPRRPGE